MSGHGVVTVIQARLGSSRLPAKVLLPLGGLTILERLVERVQATVLAGTVVVATTADAEDDRIASLCARLELPCVRGHATDLLDRHRQAAELFDARHIVKIPSDCPLIDPVIIDEVIERYLAAGGGLDYVSNLHPMTQPDGCDVEIFSRELLELAWREAAAPHEREHTTPFFWDQPGRFRTSNVRRRDGRDLSRSHRVVLDYREDHAVIRAVFDALYPIDPCFTMDDIVRWLDAHPEIARLNEAYRGVNWYRHHLQVLRTIGAADTRHVAGPA
jgi:spore coat polysaccharide biosynthesis protein SpsF